MKKIVARKKPETVTDEPAMKVKPIPEKSSRSSKAKSNKDTEAGTSSKKQKTTKENKDPIDLFDEENMEKMRDFVANALILQARKEERKEELKDLEIKDCTDLSNDELVK